MDRSQFSPALQAKIVFAGANNTSYQQAQQQLEALAELQVSDKHIRRLCKAIGNERVAERDAEVAAYQAKPLTERKEAPADVPAPDVAVVGVDGGRLQIFERGHQAAAAAAAEEIQDDVPLPETEAANAAPTPRHWREDKIGLLLTMTSKEHAADPCPEIPASFVNPHWIPELAKELSKRAAGADPPAAAAAVPRISLRGAESQAHRPCPHASPSSSSSGSPPRAPRTRYRRVPASSRAGS